MDHKVSKDMISSGMIPSGEKTQADLGRTQYGSAPSPSKLMDAYKSMYGNKEEVINEHHKKDADGNTIPHEDEEINEGKIPAGLQAYLDKKKGKKEDKKDMKEQYDLVYEHFIGEGFSEEEIFEKMSNLTEEQLDEFMKALATRAAQYGANLGREKKIDFTGGIQRRPFEAKRKPFDAKPKVGEQGFKAKSPTDVVMSAAVMNRKKETVSNQTKDSGQNIMDKNKIKNSKGPDNKKDVRLPFEQVDLFDVISEKLIEEGYSKKESYKIMSNLTEEQLEELNEFVISGTLATLGAIGGKLAAATAGLAKGAMVAGKAGLAAGTKGLAAAGKGLAAGGKAAMKGVVSAAKPVTKSATAVKDLAGKGVSSAKNMASNVGQQVKKVPSTQPTGGSGEDRLKRIKDFAKREIGQETKRRVLQGGGQPAGTNKTGFASAAKTDIAASADLFDIVKGQLLDEGLSEEEIKDIMLTLTPDEILSEIKDYQMDSLKRQTAPGGGKDYKIEDKKNVQNLAKKEVLKPFEKKGARTKSGIVGSYVEKPTTEEYKNFDPKKPDPKQVAAQAQLEKNKQKSNDPMGVKNANIGGRGKDLG